MTTVIITDTTIRALNHAGATGTCVAVSAIVQTAARVLDAGKALDGADLEHEPPRYEIRAAVGDFADDSVPIAQRALIARERAGRRAFVKAVFDGTYITLRDLASLNPAGLEVLDKRGG